MKINGQEVYSAESNITIVNAVTDGTITPATQTVLSGYAVLLTHSGSAGVIGRQWQMSADNGSNWTGITGAYAETFGTSGLTNSGSTPISYWFRVKINGWTVYSAVSEVIVLPAVTVGTISPRSKQINPGDSVTLTHSDSQGVNSRQWQVNIDNGSAWIDIPGATADTYNTGALNNTGTKYIAYRYRVKINGMEIYALASVIIVNKVDIGIIYPDTRTVLSGDSVTMEHLGSMGLSTRQWQLSRDNGSTWTDIPGATTAIYKTGILTNTGPDITLKYRVKINDGTHYTAESVIMVTTGVTPGSISPATRTIYSGGWAALTHSGSKAVSSRQWQLSTDNGSTWTDISGATASTFNTGTMTNTGTTGITHTFRVKVNNLDIYSAISVITVSGSGGSGDPGGGGTFPEGTIRFTYDMTGNRVTRNKVIHMVDTISKTKSSVDEVVGEIVPEVTEDTTVNEIPKYEEILTEMKITIFPNPTKGMLQIDITGGEISKEAKIHIYNQTGALVRQVNGVSGSNVVDISSQPAGIYLLRITLSKDSVSVWKVIKD